jgi:hypothetical protein
MSMYSPSQAECTDKWNALFVFMFCMFDLHDIQPTSIILLDKGQLVQLNPPCLARFGCGFSAALPQILSCQE